MMNPGFRRISGSQKLPMTRCQEWFRHFSTTVPDFLRIDAGRNGCFWCQRPFSSHGGPPWIQIEMSRARLKVNIFKLTRQCNFGIYIILRAKLGVHALGFSRPGCRRGEGFAGSFAAPLHSWSLQSFLSLGCCAKVYSGFQKAPRLP